MGRRAASIAVALSAVALLAACGGSDGAATRRTEAPRAVATTLPPPATTIAPTAPPTTPPPTVTSVAFASSVAPVTAGDLGASWHDGCPVGPDSLRRVTLSYWDFSGQPQRGALVVHADVVDDVVTVFRRLFEQRFPIRRMETIDKYGGSDDASMDADNTSAFNCRLAVTTGPAQWSVHAYGKAIDVNPVENPYVEGGRVLPPAGDASLDRNVTRPGFAGPGTVVNDAFASVGWQWGGRWSGSPDYQHFSQTGG